ncbi:hypothetical protein DAKH74_034660 [Maudiozyma humilis]|uniref:Uncharacterized protein n=1 Tax=Maudiozyma humilis TaxID=51915 RepID=A0AAV5RZM0_MAUHU|nr:hypothetical protein DAKH74_034660 [Kazachstania humilis]
MKDKSILLAPDLSTDIIKPLRSKRMDYSNIPTPITAAVPPPDFVHIQGQLSLRRIRNDGPHMSSPSTYVGTHNDYSDKYNTLKENCVFPYNDPNTMDSKKENHEQTPFEIKGEAAGSHPTGIKVRDQVNRRISSSAGTVVYTPANGNEVSKVRSLLKGRYANTYRNDLYITTLFNNPQFQTKHSKASRVKKVKKCIIDKTQTSKSSLMLSAFTDINYRFECPITGSSLEGGDGSSQNLPSKSLFLSDDICKLLAIENNPYRSSNISQPSQPRIQDHDNDCSFKFEDTITIDALCLPNCISLDSVDVSNESADFIETSSIYSEREFEELVESLESLSLKERGIFLKDETKESEEELNCRDEPVTLEPKTNVKYHRYYRFINKEPKKETVDPITQILTAPIYKSPRKRYHLIRRHKNYKTAGDEKHQTTITANENKRNFHRTRWWLNLVE